MSETQTITQLKSLSEEHFTKSCNNCKKRLVCKFFSKIDTTIDYIVISGLIENLLRYKILELIGGNCIEYEKQ